MVKKKKIFDGSVRSYPLATPSCSTSHPFKRPLFACDSKMTPASKIMATVSSIFLPPTSSFSIPQWRHSELLETTSLFLLQRYLGYEQIRELFTEQATAYESATPWSFIVDHQFPFPIESVQATHSPLSCYTDVNYASDLLLANERMFFDPSSLKIQSIQTTYSHGHNSSSFTPRITTCGGLENPDMITALSSARLLHLACRFLKADVTQDLSMQTKLLADDAIAFGIQGRYATCACEPH